MARTININLVGFEKTINLKLAAGEYRQKAIAAYEKLATLESQEEQVQLYIDFLSEMTNLTKEELDDLTSGELLDLFMSALGDQESLLRVKKITG